MSSIKDGWQLCSSKNVRQSQPPIPGLCILQDSSKYTNHNGFYNNCHSRGSVDSFDFVIIIIIIIIIIIKLLLLSGFKPGRTIAPIPHCNWNCPLKKRPRGQFVTPQNLGKKLERKHTWVKRFSSVQNYCKLKQNVESIFYRTFKVHPKVTFQSRPTEHVHLMLNQAWWMHLAIFNMSHRKRFRTLESFFAPNQSQSESEKHDTEEEQCINQEEMDEDRRKPKKSLTFQKTWLRDHTCAMKRRRTSASN